MSFTGRISIDAAIVAGQTPYWVGKSCDGAGLVLRRFSDLMVAPCPSNADISLRAAPIALTSDRSAYSEPALDPHVFLLYGDGTANIPAGLPPAPTVAGASNGVSVLRIAPPAGAERGAATCFPGNGAAPIVVPAAFPVARVLTNERGPSAILGAVATADGIDLLRCDTAGVTFGPRVKRAGAVLDISGTAEQFLILDPGAGATPEVIDPRTDVAVALPAADVPLRFVDRYLVVRRGADEYALSPSSSFENGLPVPAGTRFLGLTSVTSEGFSYLSYANGECPFFAQTIVH